MLKISCLTKSETAKTMSPQIALYEVQKNNIVKHSSSSTGM
jgi:hypothetical protein